MEDNNQSQSPYFYGQLPPGQSAQSGENIYAGQSGMQPMQGQPIQGQQVQGQPMQMQPGTPMYAGQPMQPGQGMAYFQPPIPPSQPVKKKHTGLLIGGILLIAVLVLALIGGLFYYFVWRTPQRRLARGLINMAKEMQDYGNPVMEEIDLAEIINNRKDSGSFDLRMNLGLPLLADLPTVGLDLVRDYDYEAENMQISFDISAYNVALFESRATVIGNTLYLEIPDVLSHSYSADLSSLGEDYNNSVWAELFGIQIDDDLRYDFFAHSETAEDDSLVQLGRELAEVFVADLAEIGENMVIEESGENKKIERNGKTVTCEGILVTLDKDDLEEMVDDMREVILNSDYVEELIDQTIRSVDRYNARGEFKELLKESMEEGFNLELKDDLKICFYLDSRDRILAVETYDGIKFKNSRMENLQFFLEFTGSDQTLDNIAGEILLKYDGDEFTIEIEREIELTKDIYGKTFTAAISMEGEREQIEIEYVSSWDIAEKEFDLDFILDAPSDTLSMSAKGAFSEIKKGEAFTFDLGRFNLSANGETLLTLSGSLRLDPLEDSIKAPDDARDFFKLSQFEILELVMELNEVLEDLNY